MFLNWGWGVSQCCLAWGQPYVLSRMFSSRHISWFEQILFSMCRFAELRTPCEDISKLQVCSFIRILMLASLALLEDDVIDGCILRVP